MGRHEKSEIPRNYMVLKITTNEKQNENNAYHSLNNVIDMAIRGYLIKLCIIDPEYYEKTDPKLLHEQIMTIVESVLKEHSSISEETKSKLKNRYTVASITAFHKPKAERDAQDFIRKSSRYFEER